MTDKFWFIADGERYESYSDAVDSAPEGTNIHVMSGNKRVLDIPGDETENWRQCSVCGKMMQAGFYVEDFEYYCSEECLKQVYSWDEYLDMYAEDIAYWSEWF